METSQHWNKIYSEKSANEVSWTESEPSLSLEWIQKYNLPKNASIIDIGGGESVLVDALLNLGYTNLSVLDISEIALQKTKKRLGRKADNVRFIVSDILHFNPSQKYDLWHDRAVFHFLTAEAEREQYLKIVSNNTNNLVIGTFADTGPNKCSGLPVFKNTEASLTDFFKTDFKIVETKFVIHITPFNTKQDFVFGRFTAN